MWHVDDLITKYKVLTEEKKNQRFTFDLRLDFALDSF